MKRYLTVFTVVLLVTFLSIQSPTYAQWQKHFIDANFTYPTLFQIGDIDNDSDLDMVITSYELDDVVWYENNGEIPATWSKHTIDGNLDGALCVSIADIDGDDTLDVVITGESADNVVWYKNNLKGTSWLKHTITTNLDGANWVNVADLDGDLDMDVIADGNLSDKVIWCENNGDEPITWTKHTIDENLDNARQMRIADIDGDTDLDIVAAGYGANDLVWYENNLPETIWNKHFVDENLNGAIGISLGDIDGDSKIDIAAAGEIANEVVWYKNNHPTWTKYTIANLNLTRAVDLTDIDGDNDLDVIATSSSDNDVVWFENNYPNLIWTKYIIDLIWTKYIIDENLSRARGCLTADIDNDNDPDVFAVGQTANDIVWYKNPYSSQKVEASFEFEGLTRSYEVHLPPNYKSNMSVVLCLHGGTDNIEMIRNYSEMHKYGFNSGFITVYPGAYGPLWNTGNVPTATANDVGFISALIDTLKADYDINLSRVYSCGFGQGGAFSYKLVGELSHRITAVASVEGLMCEAMLTTSAPVREVPILHIHGTKDTYEPWEGTDDPLYLLSVDETINHWVQKNECSPFYNTVSLPDIEQNDGCTVEKTSYNNSAGDTTVILYKVNNGGHNWPGASSNFNWEGKKTRDIQANIEIWNFFNKFSHSPIAESEIIEGSFEFDGLSRNYIVYKPQNYQSNMPLVVMLHGSYPDDAEWMMNYTQMNEVADTAGFIVVYPYSVSPRWNANSGIPSISEPNVNDVGYIETLIDTMKSQYNIDLSSVYCCGLNYGGWMASELICQISNRFAAGARVNTSLGYNQAARSTLERTFPVVLFNGTADSYLPWPDGKEGVMGGEEAISWWVEHNKCSPFYNTVSLPDIDPNDGCTVEKISYIGSSDETKVVFYKVLNGGLSWPGAVGDETWDKPRNMDINAGVEIWNFFKDFVIPTEDTLKETWTRKADLQTARKSHSSCVLDEKIYVIGGLKSGTALKSVEVYDPALDSWTQKADMSSGRVGLSTCEFNGKILAIGGSQSMNGAPIISIEEYDPYFNIWSHKTNMPRARIGLTASVVNDKIYIIGGYNSTGTSRLVEVDVYNLLTGDWTIAASLPTPRANLASVVINGKIYAMGGTFGSSGGYLGLDIVEVYDPTTDKWSGAENMITKRKNFAACELDDHIFVFGGSNLDCGGILSSVESYDPSSNTWEEKSSMPSILGGPSAAQLNGKIYISGGSTKACPADPQYTMYEYAQMPTSIDQELVDLEVPQSFVLNQNYPNPFNPSTTFKYEIPKESYLTLKVYDILGREVATLVNKQQKAGYYEVSWNAVNNSSGIYFYRLETNTGFAQTKKLVLLK